MKIRISDLPPQGLSLKGEIPLSPLNSRLNEGHESDILFTTAPIIEVLVSPNTQGAELKGSVKSKYKQPCGRCAKEVDRDIELELALILKQRPPKGSPDAIAEDYCDDIGLVYFDGDYVDLEPTVQESLILALSLYWSPQLDKDGKCTVCLQNCSTPTTLKVGSGGKLGDLLKKAGVN